MNKLTFILLLAVVLVALLSKAEKIYAAIGLVVAIGMLLLLMRRVGSLGG